MVDPQQDHPTSDTSSRDSVRRRAKKGFTPPSDLTVDEALNPGSLDDVLGSLDEASEKKEDS